MNIPFAPVWLWPLGIGLVVGAILWRRWQKIQRRASQAESAEKRPQGWKGSASLAWLTLVLGLVVTYTLWRYSAPCVHGRVLDARTGKPVAGALIIRELFRPGRFQLTEGFSATMEAGSRVKVVTDAQGRFHLPGWVSLLPIGFKGFGGMSWVVFQPGLMPYRECLMEGFHAGLGCGPFGVFRTPDPWAKIEMRRRIGSIRVEVRLFPSTVNGIEWAAKTWSERDPTTGQRVLKHFPEDVDPWGEYFQRLNLLVQDDEIPVEDFVKEAVAYAEHAVLNDAVARNVDQVLFSLGEEDARRKGLALALARIVVRYCDANPNSPYCQRIARPMVRLRRFVSQPVGAQ